MMLETDVYIRVYHHRDGMMKMMQAFCLIFCNPLCSRQGEAGLSGLPGREGTEVSGLALNESSL